MKYRSRYKNSKLLKAKQEDAKFRRITFWGLAVFFLIGSSIWIIAYYGCEIRYWYRLKTFYGKEIEHKWVCMDGNKLRYHRTLKYDINYHFFNVCSTDCYEQLSKNYNAAAYAVDTISGKKILKSDAIISLKEKKHPDLIYFENKENLEKYYKNNK